MITYQCIISGKVQGVFYRSHIQKMASDAGFDGYVMNLPNGKVEACVTLIDEKKLPYFLDILKTGSPYSCVEQIETRKINSKLNSGFFIKR